MEAQCSPGALVRGETKPRRWSDTPTLRVTFNEEFETMTSCRSAMRTATATTGSSTRTSKVCCAMSAAAASVTWGCMPTRRTV